MPIPRELMLLGARSILERATDPKRARIKRRIRKLEASKDEYPSDYAPPGEDWLSHEG